MHPRRHPILALELAAMLFHMFPECTFGRPLVCSGSVTQLQGCPHWRRLLLFGFIVFGLGTVGLSDSSHYGLRKIGAHGTQLGGHSRSLAQTGGKNGHDSRARV